MAGKIEVPWFHLDKRKEKAREIFIAYLKGHNPTVINTHCFLECNPENASEAVYSMDSESQNI